MDMFGAIYTFVLTTMNSFLVFDEKIKSIDEEIKSIDEEIKSIDEITNFSNSTIEKKNTKNINKTSVTPWIKMNDEEITEAILLLIAEYGKQSAQSLADILGVSVPKVTALAKSLVDSGDILVTKERFAGSSVKVNVYSVPIY